MHRGDQVTILVRITPPLSGAPIARVSVYPKSAPPAVGGGWTITGTGLQYLPGLLARPMTIGTDVWMAQIETVEGCTDTTAGTGPNARTFQVTR